MRIDLDIPGGPISVVLTDVKTDAYSARGWWTVGGRKLQVSHLHGEPWRLTGHGLPARAERAESFPLPTAAVRRAFRDKLRQMASAGATVDAYATDLDRHGALYWGWDDAQWWVWTDDAAGYNRSALPEADAIAWMRAQARAVGLKIRADD